MGYAYRSYNIAIFELFSCMVEVDGGNTNFQIENQKYIHWFQTYFTRPEDVNNLPLPKICVASVDGM